MRSVIVCAMISLDGYIGNNNKSVTQLPIGVDASADPFHNFNLQHLRRADTVLAGRTSYEIFQNYWPAIQYDTVAASERREISRLNSTLQKVVVSDGLRLSPGDEWYDSTTIVSRAQSHDTVRAMRQERGKDIVVFGSPTL